MTSDPSQPIVVALISALGAVIAAAFAGLVSLVRRENGGGNSSHGTPPLGERTAVLEQRANDSDERDDVQDRWLKRLDTRVERIERERIERERIERERIERRLSHDDEERRT